MNLGPHFYHAFVSLLLLEQALRASAWGQQIQEEVGRAPGMREAFAQAGVSSFGEYVERIALAGLLQLASEDGSIGMLRALNALRVASGMHEFPLNILYSISEMGVDRIWHWFKSEPSAAKDSEISIEALQRSLSAVRDIRPEEVYRKIADFVPLLVEEGLVAETWKRIKALDSLLHVPPGA
jgi:hypothetical protein